MIITTMKVVTTTAATTIAITTTTRTTTTTTTITTIILMMMMLIMMLMLMNVINSTFKNNLRLSQIHLLIFRKKVIIERHDDLFNIIVLNIILLKKDHFNLCFWCV